MSSVTYHPFLAFGETLWRTCWPFYLTRELCGWVCGIILAICVATVFGFFFVHLIHLQMYHSAPVLLLGRDCQGIFLKLNFQMLPPHSYAFYISLLEIRNWNLFPPSGFLSVSFFFSLFFLTLLECLMTGFRSQPVSSWNETSQETNCTTLRWRGCEYILQKGFAGFRHRQECRDTTGNIGMEWIP